MVISPGFETNIGLTKQYIEALPSPYNDCMGDLTDSSYDYLVKKSSVMQVMKNVFQMTYYDQETCVKICMQKYMIDNCKCALFNLPPYYLNQTNMGCNEPWEQNCTAYYDVQFYAESADNACHSQCPDSCVEMKYHPKMSVSNYPTDWYINTFFSNESIENVTALLNNRVALVNIFLEEMSYIHIFQTPSYTIESILATVGGHMASVLKVLIEWYSILISSFF